MCGMLALPLLTRLGVVTGQLGFIGVVVALCVAMLLGLLLVTSVTTLLHDGHVPGRTLPWLVQRSIGSADGAALAVAVTAFHVFTAACVSLHAYRYYFAHSTQVLHLLCG